MSNPSFLFSGLSPSVAALNEALDRVGGGDARAASMEVHCLIGSPARGSDGVLWAGSTSVGVRNIDLPASTPASAAMKYYDVTSSSPLVRRDHLFLNVLPHDSVTRWLCDGFNASVITYGGRMTFKTSAIFGDPSLRPDEAAAAAPCMARCILEDLFEEARGGGLTVGLSCWALRGENATDLLDPHPQGGRLRDRGRKRDSFLAVECDDLQTALSALALARSRCPGAQAYETAAPVQERQRAHFFCRVMVHRADRRGGGCLSCLHLVDLVGAAPAGDAAHARMAEEDRIARRATAVQLSTLARVLQEMREASSSAHRLCEDGGDAFSAEARMTSARESKLTQMMAPILQGNSKTWLLCFLMDGEQHHTQSMHSLRALEGVGGIKSACSRVTGVPVGALRLESHRNVLPSQDFHPAPTRELPYEQPQQHDSGHLIPKGGVMEDHFSDGELDYPSSLGAPAPHSRSPVRFQDGEEGGPEEVVMAAGPSPCFDSLMEEYHRFQNSCDDLLSPVGASPHSKHPISHAPDPAQRIGAALNGQVDDGPQQLTPYYHTMSGGSPIEELLMQEMKNDEAHRAIQFGESRMQFDQHNFSNIQEYAMNDRHRDNERERADELQASYDRCAREGISLSADMAQEYRLEYLEHQGMYDNNRLGRDRAEVAQPLGRGDREESLDDVERRGGNEIEVGAASARPHGVNPGRGPEDDRITATARASGQQAGLEGDPASSLDYDALESGDEAPISSDVLTLQKLNTSLMKAVRRECKVRKDLEEKVESILLSCDEEKEKMAIQIDDMKLEASKLRHMMRRMAGENSLEDTLKYFEEEMKVLAAENTMLRQRNLSLEEHNKYNLQPGGGGGDVTMSSYDDDADATSEGCARRDVMGTPDSRGASARSTTPLTQDTPRQKSLAAKDIVWTSMDGMSSSSGTETAEIRVLKAALRRSKKDYELVSNRIDDAKKKERRGVMSIKLYEDCSKKLLQANAEVDRLKKEVDFERDARFQRERDIGILQGELGVLQSSERELRNERSRTLSELASARQRIRELEIERTKYASFDRFVQKHTASKWGEKRESAGKSTVTDSTVWGSGKSTQPVSRDQKSRTHVAGNPRTTRSEGSNIINESNEHLVVSSFDTPGLASRMVHNNSYDVATPQLQQHKTNRPDRQGLAKKSPPPLPAQRQNHSKGILKISNGNMSSLVDISESEMEKSISRGVVGVAGLSNAQYLRLEEAEPLSPALEQSLLALHDTIALTSPSLLPLVGKLGTDLKEERAMSVQQRAAMMAQMQKQQYLDATRE